MGRAVWVTHTVDLEWNSVIEGLPHRVDDGGARLEIGELQDNCLLLRALSAHRYRIVWEDRRFRSDGRLVLYPDPAGRRATTLDLRLNPPPGPVWLLRRKWHLRAMARRLLMRLTATLKET